jgi:hypothetical protein
MAIYKDNKIGSGPNISEAQWYSFAIASVIITAIAVVVAFVYIFWDGFDGDRDAKLAQAFAPFGSISSRQANQAESEGRAKLLQEGAKLLGEVDKPSYVSAGIATLGVLVTGPDRDYALQAMNLLAGLVEGHMVQAHTSRHLSEICRVLSSGEERGLNTGRVVTFHPPEPGQGGSWLPEWHYIPGFAGISYISGVFRSRNDCDINSLNHVRFYYVDILFWKDIVVDERYTSCKFLKCSINSVESLKIDKISELNSEFVECNFSGCAIHDVSLLEIDLKSSGNFYILDNPPVLKGGQPFEWSTILNVKA